MKYKLKNGLEVDLHDEDIQSISKLNKENSFSNMNDYFIKLHKHAIEKMEDISDHVIYDEDSIDIAGEFVAKHGTYKDFVKFLRYSRDYDIAHHILESTK